MSFSYCFCVFPFCPVKDLGNLAIFSSWSLVSVTCLAWFSEESAFAVGYVDGKLLIGLREARESGGIVLVDAHKVQQSPLALARLNCLHSRKG